MRNVSSKCSRRRERVSLRSQAALMMVDAFLPEGLTHLAVALERAGKVFNIASGCLCLMVDIDGFRHEPEPQVGAHPADKILVLIRFRSTDAVVQMSHAEREMKFRSECV